MRWAKLGHSIIIGSRDPERAKTKAAELRDVAHAIPIVGHGNAEAAKLGDVVVVALPAAGLANTLPEAREACRGKVVVSTVVSLTFGGPRLFTPPAAGSSAEEVQALLPEAKVVRRELAGVPKVEVVGLSKEKVEELFWETITQVRADLAGVSRK